MRVEFTVPGKPVAKGRPKFARMGTFVRAYTPEKTVNYETLVKVAAAEAMGDREPIEGPVSIIIAIYVPIPVSESRKRSELMASGQILPTKKPDADNVLKAVKDAVNGVVWRDDSQVVDVVLSKRYSLSPRVCVTVEPSGPWVEPIVRQSPQAALELAVPVQVTEAMPF